MKNTEILKYVVVSDSNNISTPFRAENEESVKNSISGSDIIIQIFSKLEKLLLTKKFPKPILQIKNVQPINKNLKNKTRSLK